MILLHTNPLFPNAPFLYLLKNTYFQGVQKGCNGKEWVKKFFLSGFSFTNSDNSQDKRRKKGGHPYSSLSISLAQEHSDVYLQL